jgi:hypothetical protein
MTLKKPIPIRRYEQGPAELRLVYEQSQYFWHLSRKERRVAMRRTKYETRFEYWDLMHWEETLAGFCTQVMSNGTIRPEQLDWFYSAPDLGKSGPFAEWVAMTERDLPLVYCWAMSIELMRLLLLEKMGPRAPDASNPP